MDKDIIYTAERINAQKIKNFNYFKICANYLNNFPNMVTSEIICEISQGTDISKAEAFSLFLSNVFIEDKKARGVYEKEYFSPSIKELNVESYKSDPYYKNIKIPQKKIGNWTLGSQKYLPYEGFIYKDITVKENFCEIPHIGFFTEEFVFPTVFENGNEWMAIKPNEIETMKEPLSKMYGKVAVFGLGLGYFAYMVAQNENVKEITVIEKDENVIKLFYDNILPQFENASKIKVVKSDAFDFVKKMGHEKFDTAFVDLWHDTSDGVDLYVKMKKSEIFSKGTKFEYWIEKSILSSIRWRVFDGIYESIKNGKFELPPHQNIENILSDEYLKSFVKYI